MTESLDNACAELDTAETAIAHVAQKRTEARTFIGRNIADFRLHRLGRIAERAASEVETAELIAHCHAPEPLEPINETAL